MADAFYGALLETIGMEYESLSMRREDAQELLSTTLPKFLGGDYKKVGVTRDASLEYFAETLAIASSRRVYSMHTPGFSSLANNRLGDTRTMGFEVFTSPLEISVFEKVAHILMGILSPMGDFTSNRAAVHFHTGFGNNLRFMKNMLAIGLHMEPFFYRLGGMGGTFRGFSNACAYARPLMNAAAVLVKNPPRKPEEMSDEEVKLLSTISMNPLTSSDLHKIQEAKERLDVIRHRLGIKPKWYKIINPMEALEADSLKKFWACFGVDYDGSIKKYHPCRYVGLNFFSIAQHGTIEFRYFNQTLDPSLIVATGKFCRMLAELATQLSKREIQKFPVRDSSVQIGMADADDSMHMVLEMAREKEIENIPDPSEVTLIMETLEASRFEPLPENTVKTHKPEFSLSPALVLLGNLQEETNPIETCHVEIHNIGNDVSLYDKGDNV